MSLKVKTILLWVALLLMVFFVGPALVSSATDSGPLIGLCLSVILALPTLRVTLEYLKSINL